MRVRSHSFSLISASFSLAPLRFELRYNFLMQVNYIKDFEYDAFMIWMMLGFDDPSGVENRAKSMGVSSDDLRVEIINSGFMCIQTVYLLLLHMSWDIKRKSNLPIQYVIIFSCPQME